MNVLEKILEEIEEEIRDSIPFSEQRADGLRKARDIIRKQINDLSRENRQENTRSPRDNGGWIPVEERLPEDYSMMLVTCKTKSGSKNVNGAWYGEGFWHGSGSMSRVIAWQPLPEPYRPEKGTEE